MAIDAPPRADQAPVSVPWLFQRLRWSLLRNTFKAMLGRPTVPGGLPPPGGGNWARPVTILIVSVVVAGFVFGLSFAGFWFLRHELHLPMDAHIVPMLIDLLFITLGTLLLFSTALIVYGSLFTGPEPAFLLSRPVPDDQIFAFKFQGAVAFSSWAFLLLGGPILTAYGIISQAPFYFYLLLPFFFFGFVLLPGACGSLAVLLIVNFIPRQRKHVLITAIVGILIAISYWGYRQVDTARQLLDPRGIDNHREVLTKLDDQLSFVANLLLPSHWVARGLENAAEGRLVTGLVEHPEDGALFNLGMIWANGLFVYMIAGQSSRWLYRRGYNRMSELGSQRRLYRVSYLDRLIEVCLWFARPTTRLLMVKDFRTFRRDPQQWGQVLVIGGLMALYFGNSRNLWVTDMNWRYQNILSILNFCVIGLMICTWTGRFVYPLISLEGKKFWVLGLLPLERSELLWGKFAFSTASCLVVSVGLVLLSDGTLVMPLDVVLLHLLTVVVLAAGLSGLSVGLGACMPNFRETDPSKIAVGFGGTLNLVACLGFLVLILLLMIAPWHLQMALQLTVEERPALLWLISGCGVAAGLAAGMLVIYFPLRVGIRTLEKMEF
jgi:ABC-2 type transport system permease protein